MSEEDGTYRLTQDDGKVDGNGKMTTEIVGNDGKRASVTLPWALFHCFHTSSLVIHVFSTISPVKSNRETLGGTVICLSLFLIFRAKVPSIFLNGEW